MDGLVISVAVMVALLGASGVVLISVAVTDWKTRLISLRALAALVLLRMGLALCSLAIGCIENSGGNLDIALVSVVQTLCSQVSFSALLYSGISALGLVAVITLISAVVKACMVASAKRKQHKQHKQYEQCGWQELQELQETQKQREQQEPLGSGDTKLIGVCCLYLSFVQLPIFLLVVTAGSLCLALYFLVRYKDKTFPLAPTIVFACLVAFMV